MFLLLRSYQLIFGSAGHQIVIGDGSHSPSKEVVIAALRDNDMSWLSASLPDWHANIYRADMRPDETNLTVPVSRANEAMVYLT